MSNTATFSLFTGRDGQYYWNLKAPNMETLCHSEGYTTKQNAQHGIQACKYASQEGRFTLFTGRDGQIYWHLKAPNGQILCHSEGYTSKQAAENGVYATQRYAPTALVKEQVTA